MINLGIRALPVLAEAATPMTLAELWTAITTSVGSVLGLVGDVGSAILSNVLFQAIFGVGMAFIAVAMFKKLVHVRA